MGTISFSPPTDGTTADASDVVTPLNTIYNEFNGNIDNANIKSGAAIATSKLADDAGITTAKIADASVTSAKLAEAFLRGRYQANTTNTAPTGLTMQMGWGYITGAGTNTATKAVTFPVAFSSTPIVLVSPSSGSSAGSTTYPPSQDGTYSDNIFANASIPTTTGFKCYITRPSGVTFTNGHTVFFTWIAIGTV